MNVTEDQVNECSNILKMHGFDPDSMSWTDVENLTKAMHQFAELQIARNGKTK